MSIRMRHTSGHRNRRRAHHALISPHTVPCSKCKVLKLPHSVCANCGTYRERQFIDVLLRLTKKEKKQKEKELEEQEAHPKPEPTLSAEELSKS